MALEHNAAAGTRLNNPNVRAGRPDLGRLLLRKHAIVNSEADADEEECATEENVHKVLSIKDINRGYYAIQIIGPQCKMNTGLMID